jgi:hypothetical protein
MHNVRVIQYSIRLPQDTEKRHWINKVNINVFSHVMTRVFIVLRVFVTVSDGHKPTKDSSWRWRQRSCETLKSVYQTTRCRKAEDRTNDIANIENVWEKGAETSVSQWPEEENNSEPLWGTARGDRHLSSDVISAGNENCDTLRTLEATQQFPSHLSKDMLWLLLILQIFCIQ